MNKNKREIWSEHKFGHSWYMGSKISQKDYSFVVKAHTFIIL